MPLDNESRNNHMLELEQEIARKEHELLVLKQKLLLNSTPISDANYSSKFNDELHLLLEWVNFLNDSVQICDDQGNFVFVNANTAVKTGYTLNELLSMNIQDIEVDFVGVHNWNKRLEHLKAKQSVIQESTNLRKDGSTFSVEVHARYAEIKGKGYVVIISQDITEKKAKETQLRRNKYILKEILNNTSEAIFFVDTQTDIIVDCNERALELFEFDTKDQLIGRQGRILLKNPMEDADLKKIKQEIRDAVTWNTEYLCVTRNGREFWGSMSSHIVKLQNESPYFLVRVTDIDLRKKADEELLRSEKRYRDLIKYNQALICTHDMQGVIINVNPASCKSVGYEESELIGKSLRFLFDPKNMASYDAYLKKINEEGQASGIMQVLNKEGKRMYWQFHNYKVEDEGAPYVVGSAQDITERILVQKELKKAISVAEQSLKTRELFLANVSHELRTPLHGILGISGLLSKTELNEDQDKLLNIVRKSAENLVVIINDILDVAKMESGKLQFEHIPFRFCDTMHNALAPLKLKSETKGLRFEIDLPCAALTDLVGDPYRLSQIITNLTNNAIKFTEKGSIKVSAEILDESDEMVVLDITVKDTGIGISPTKIEHIFDEFVQADRSHTRIYGGTGLGLSISKKLVELLDGKLYVDSEVGKGSKFGFILTFPKATEHVRHPQNKAHFNFDLLKDTKILLAEDNLINQMIAQRVLEQGGALVHIAENGNEALRLFQENEYDVVLMDIQMPDMDGEEVTAMIRTLSDPLKATVPIIALTANAMKGDNEKYLKAGMDNYLSKPFTQEELFQKIAHTLQFPAREKAKEDAKDGKVSIVKHPHNLYDLSKLCEMLKDLTLVRSFMKAFVHSVPKEMDFLKLHIASDNYMEMKSLLHKIKPSLLHLQNPELNEVLQKAQVFLMDENHEGAKNELGKLIALTERIIEDLKERPF